MLASAYQLRIQQKVVEDGNRTQIGLWLRENAASPKDTVFMEPLGYIGFFSGLKTYDFPGLSSMEMVNARKAVKSNVFFKLIEYLKPNWVVLRPWSAQRVKNRRPDLLTKTYTQVMDFDVSDEVSSYKVLPGRGYLRFDERFLVFKRNDD